MDWHDPQHDSLDELLRAACFPEPRVEQFDRLEHEWRRLVWQRRRRVWATSLATAVLLPIAAFVTFRAFVRDRQPVAVEVAEPTKTSRPRVVQDSLDFVPVSPQVVDAPNDKPRPQPQYVRDPNVFEQTLVMLHRRRVNSERPRIKEAKKADERSDPFNAAVQRLVDEPEFDMGILVEDLARRCSDCERRLRRRMEAMVKGRTQELDAETSASQSRALLRLLAAVATQASFSVLAEAATQENCPAEVFDALSRLSSVEQLTARVDNETSPERKRLWLAALLERRDPPATTAYLAFAGQPATSRLAVEAAGRVKNRSLDGLFAALFDSRVTIRLTAARVLGELNDPDVSKRLAQMALDNVGRREALVALLQSSDQVAHKFLSYAQSDLVLAPSLRAISLQLSESNPVN